MMITFEWPTEPYGKILYEAILRRIALGGGNEGIKKNGCYLEFHYDSFVELGYFENIDCAREILEETIEIDLAPLCASIKNNRTGKKHKHGTGKTHLFRGINYGNNAFSMGVCDRFNWDLLLINLPHDDSEVIDGKYVIKDDEGMEIFLKNDDTEEELQWEYQF